MSDTSPQDPAKARFFIINVVRMGGVMFVVLGILATTGRIWADELGSARAWAGYLLIAFGVINAFVSPAILIRKWRTPK